MPHIKRTGKVPRQRMKFRGKTIPNRGTHNRESPFLSGGSASTWHQKVPLGGWAERSATRAGRSQDKELQKIRRRVTKNTMNGSLLCQMSNFFMLNGSFLCQMSNFLCWMGHYYVKWVIFYVEWVIITQMSNFFMLNGSLLCQMSNFFMLNGSLLCQMGNFFILNGSLLYWLLLVGQ